MSGSSKSNGPVRLIVADQSENAANAIDSRLRDAGIATRFQYVDDLSMALEHMSNIDLLLCNASLDGTSSAIPELRKHGPNVPIVLLTTNPTEPFDAEQGMLLGASDVVPIEQRERLLMVCRRELNNRSQDLRFDQLRQALEEAEQRCQLLLDSSKAAIAYVHEGMHIYANPGYLKLFGYAEADDLLGLPIMDLLDGETAGRLKETLKTFRASREEQTIDFAATNAAGEAIAGTMTLAAAEYEGESCLQLTLRQSEPELPTLSDLAPPSQEQPAPTAAAADVPAASEDLVADKDIGSFLVAAENEREDASNKLVAVFVAQLDELGKHRGEFGLRGSEIICDRVALAIEQAAAPAPSVRIEAHRFGFLIAGTDRDAIIEQADAVRQAVEDTLLEVDQKTVRPTVTVGGCLIEGKESVEKTLDTAFWHLDSIADNERSNRVDLAQGSQESQVNQEAAKTLQLINEAIEKQKFRLVFQPIISLRGDSDEHYEVFMRMLDRNGETLVPHQFLRTAIDNGVAGKIDRWVILQSIKQLSVHRSRGHETRLTINVTSNCIADPGFMQWLGVAIKAARLPSDAVIFQFTEQDAATYLRQSIEFAEGLKKLHCRSSLSRFGLVEDPFAQLDDIPVDMVKIDGSIVKDMETREDVRERLNDTIKKLQSRGKLTIVPMVESAQALSSLWQAGANYIQGHYLQEPSTEMAYDFATDE